MTNNTQKFFEAFAKTECNAYLGNAYFNPSALRNPEFQADPDRGDWDGDAAIKAEARYHNLAIYWTVSEVLNRLGAALQSSAWSAIEQQKKGA